MTSMTGQSGYRGSTGANVGPTATGKWSGERIPSGYKVRQMANFDPQQMDLYNRLYGLVSPEGNTARMAAGDQSFFDQMEAPALRQFAALQGGLASRYSAGGGGRGAMSGRRSSGFQNEMSQAGMDLAERLQGKRQELMRQATNDLMTMSGNLLGQRPYDRWLEPKPKKQGWGGLFGAGVGALGGLAFGGPSGAMQGAQFGYGVGSAF